MCPYAKRIYIIPSHSSVLKLQNYSSQYSSCPFFRKIKEKLFLVIGAINEASATNSVMNLSHILFAIADAKVLCYILYSSGNIQIKNTVGVQWTNLPPTSYIKLAKTSVSRGLNLMTFWIFFQRLTFRTNTCQRLRRIYNPVEHLQWSFFEKNGFFLQNSQEKASAGVSF